MVAGQVGRIADLGEQQPFETTQDALVGPPFAQLMQGIRIGIKELRMRVFARQQPHHQARFR